MIQSNQIDRSTLIEFKSDFNQFLRQLGDEYEEFQQQLDTEYDRICD